MISPQPRTRGKPTDNGEFVVFEHVPVFDEHIGSDGTQYDAALLAAIAENCNRRIRDTGDWCPVVIAHTRLQDEKQHVNDDPPVIGLAGPFYVADFGNEDPRQCIHCHFWIYPEYEQAFLRNPRRSVEIWPEERPEDRYFDPIALLGSETPKRDLGMIYSRPRGTGSPLRHYAPGPFRYSKRLSNQKLRYQEAAPVSTPGGNNTFIPGSGNEKKLKHAKGDSRMFSPEEIQQLFEALKPSIESLISVNTDVVEDGEPAEVVATDTPVENLDPAVEDVGGMELPLDGSEEYAETPIPEDEIPMETVDTDQVPLIDEGESMYAGGLGRKFMKYMKDGELDEDAADKYMDTLDEEDQSLLGHYMKYMCDSSDMKDKYAARYAKSEIGGEDLTEKPGDSSPSGSMHEDEMTTSAEKYQKERRAAAEKYSKLQREHNELKQQYQKQGRELSDIRQKERYSRRKSVLQQLEVEGYALDVDDELENTKDFNDAQFERHTTKVIPEKYQKVSGDLLPLGGAEPRDPNKKPAPAVDEQNAAEKYAKRASDLTMRYRKGGQGVQYADVLRHLIENDGNVDEGRLLAHSGNGRA